jgi:hypothetical protein
MQLRVEPHGGLVNVGPIRQGRNRIGNEAVSSPRVWKEEDSKIQMELLRLEQGIGQVAITLLLL